MLHVHQHVACTIVGGADIIRDPFYHKFIQFNLLYIFVKKFNLLLDLFLLSPDLHMYFHSLTKINGKCSYFCSIVTHFPFGLCQFTNLHRNERSTSSGMRKLNGEIEPCRIDCLSYDLCVAGMLNCTTNDGRTAKCK